MYLVGFIIRIYHDALNVKFRASVVHIRLRYAFTYCVSSLLILLIFTLLYTVSSTPYTPFLLRSPLRSGLLRNKQISERDGQSLKYQHSLVLGLWRKGLSNNLFPTMKQVTFMSYGTPVATHSVPHTQLSYNTERNFTHTLHSRYATLAIQSCELPQGPRFGWYLVLQNPKYRLSEYKCRRILMFVWPCIIDTII